MPWIGLYKLAVDFQNNLKTALDYIIKLSPLIHHL